MVAFLLVSNSSVLYNLDMNANFPFLEREILQDFASTEGLTNLVEILTHISNNGYEKFSSYISNNGISLPPKTSASILFHGSPFRLEELNSAISLGGQNENKDQALVYASDDPNYAIFLAILDIQSGSASVHTENRKIKLSVDKEFMDGESKFIDGYLYVVDGQNFQSVGNHEHTCSTKVTILFAVKVTRQDLTEPIQTKE